MKPLIKPFKAFFYNPSQFKDISSLVCPPYDVIKDKEKEVYKHTSPYNFAHVLLVNRQKNYKALAKKISGWIKKEVLVKNKEDAVYLYEQEFSYAGKKCKRVGFLGLLKLDKKGVVFPHENTLSAPKKDRFAVMKQVKANLSPIFVISAQKVSSLSALHDKYCKRKPFLQYKDKQGHRHCIWKISEKKDVARLTNEMSRRKLFIADGHHRFQVASNYWQKYRNRFKNLNYILAYFTHPASGLLVLPTHRVVEIDQSFQDVFDSLINDFSITKVSEGELEKLLRRPQSKTNLFSFGIYHRKSFYFLKLKNRYLFDRISRQQKAYKSLDIWLLHYLVLRRFSLKNTEYVHRIDEVRKQATKKKIGFIVRTTPLETVFAIAKGGKLLPQKSTYFYPKLPSGLLVRRFDS